MKKILKESSKISYDLFKVMIPVITIIHVLKYFDLIKYFAVILSPFMEILGLPPETGIVWAMTLLNNIYGGIIVLNSLGIDGLTTAQASTLGMLMLVAHNLPIEATIAKKCGLSATKQVFFRLFSAFTFAGILKLIYTTFDLFQGPAKMLLTIKNEKLSAFETVTGEIRNLLLIFLVIFSLMLIMNFLEFIGILKFLNRILRPFMRPLNIGENAGPVTVIGLTLGLTYGAGLIISAVKKGDLEKKCVFLSVTMMGICHALIEDTFLVMTLGGEIFGLLFFRLIMGFIFIYILSYIEKVLPNWKKAFLY